MIYINKHINMLQTAINFTYVLIFGSIMCKPLMLIFIQR
jgi:hypothetical protein